MKNINERCPLSTECERRKCDYKFKEFECSYYSANVRPSEEIEGIEVAPDILDSFDIADDERQLQYIDIELIHNHPDNPRKDVGDVTELAESIKQQGIMQNLTVVPYEGEYRVIIGHRRLAASKMAGLKEVPCVVVEMSEREQLGVMLCENMQRVDLTIVEQAQGMQLMLDMGDTVPEIAKKTGLSKATVGKRVKLSRLPADKLKKAEDRGGTLEDYMKCLEIKNDKKREKLLEKVGTNDFSWNYNTLINEQKAKKNKPIMLALLKEKGVEKLKDPSERWSSKYEQVTSKNPVNWDGEDFTVKLKKNEKYFYFDGTGATDWIYIYKKAKKKKAEKKSNKEVEADRRRRELKELSQKAYVLREDFILSFTEFKKYEKEINEYFLLCAAYGVLNWVSTDSALIKKAYFEGKTTSKEELVAWIKRDKKAALIIACSLSGDDKTENFYIGSWGENYPTHNPNRVLEWQYEFLERIGYKVSTEERQLLDGTHELFKKES